MLKSVTLSMLQSQIILLETVDLVMFSGKNTLKNYQVQDIFTFVKQY